eukprot:7000081-Pyramimonas_sp.AAC.1
MMTQASGASTLATGLPPTCRRASVNGAIGAAAALVAPKRRRICAGPSPRRQDHYRRKGHD